MYNKLFVKSRLF